VWTWRTFAVQTEGCHNSGGEPPREPLINARCARQLSFARR
jgi:hypothetical protein